MEHPPHRLNFEVAGLRRSTEYAVTVQAFNGKGAGPQSEVVRVRTSISVSKRHRPASCGPLSKDPPNAPLLRVGGTTFRSISVNWENENLQEAPITGYSLYYKVEGVAGNEWHEVSVPHDRRAFTLSDLRCGTEYLVYIRATNRAGKGPQGETLSVRTNGGRPVEPDPRRLFETNTTFVVLHLEAWDSGGCPVSYFVVQYRPEARGSTPYSSSTSSEWTLHSNNVVPQQQLVQLADLVPGSWYTLLMSAHNDAGSTEVELSFATLTLAGDLPSRHYELLDPQVAFYRHLTVTVPIVSAILVLIIVVGVVCVILRKRSYESRQRIDDGMVVAECYDANKGDMVLAVSHESQARESTYYPAPYATHNRTDTMLETWEPNRETLAACMEVYEKTGLEGIYGASPLHVSKPKTPRTRRTPSWKEDGDRSSGSENDADDLLDEDCDGVVPETLIVPLDTYRLGTLTPPARGLPARVSFWLVHLSL
ncbi:hypothetical protein HPB48_023080 [Haemaphysalis longicornis]|uniref:Fibronectin type-III domain-containing protein n=1 Tax=Haemaphysalis longicornis TaxID=44386 RepID=A0A9J6GBR6_HAELO|nr:hypothetical protein HPB48_023080 [Haemaphysalis longicornis]